MPLQQTAHALVLDGRRFSITTVKTSATSVRINWTIPAATTIYDGAVVLLSEEVLTSLEFPEDGARYSASADWAAPVDVIGNAHVVAAYYGFFQDDITQNTVEVFNIDPDKVYYASIHIASNILQYHTVGRQSYAVEAGRTERQQHGYAGAIPRSTVAPEDPTNGQVYFDVTLNKVFVWNSTLDAWVTATDRPVRVGSSPYIGLNNIFYNFVDEELKFFNGTEWIVCDASNTRIKMGGGWAPFTGIASEPSYPESPVVGQMVYLTIKAQVGGPAVRQLYLYTLGSWFLMSEELVQVFHDGVWHDIVIGSEHAGGVDIEVPSIGEFFYDNSNRDLLVWDGGGWVKADVDDEGTPTTDRIGVGTDGSQEQRLRLINVLKHQLGYPQLCVELNDEQFMIAVDNAIETFRQRSDSAYVHRYISVTLKRGQSQYYLNDPRNNTDKIVNVIKVHRVNMLGLSNLASETGLYAQSFFNQLFQGGMIDLTSIHLFHQLSEQFERIFAGNLVFTWDEPSRNLHILRRISHEEERVVLEVVVERSEQELLLDRWFKQWIQAWAESEMLEMLGMIRTKYGTLPGPNGGITLNGDVLLNMASEKQAELQRQINDYEVGNGGINFGNTAFMIG